jgi:hypothetical protein
MCAIRDSQSTRGAERELLYALCLRARADRKYSCWPGYAQLSADTGLHTTTLKRAAQELERKQLIRRVVRKNSSNIWFLNVPLIVDMANAKLAEIEAAKVEEFDGFDLAPTGADEEEIEVESENEEYAMASNSWERRAN